MPKPENEVEILQALQLEAEALRAKRRQSIQEASQQENGQQRSDELQENTERLLGKAIEKGKELEHDADRALHNLAARIETATAELEDAARTRPIATLLTAVTVGIVIGQILSRK